MRERGTFTNQAWEDSDTEVMVSIGSNHENYTTGRFNGLFLELRDPFGHHAYAGVSVDNIPGMIESLQAVYDEFEANKPKEPKQVNEITDALPDGSVMHFAGESNKYVKIGGKWHFTYGEVYYDPTFSDGTWPLSRWNVIVDYNPEEAN